MTKPGSQYLNDLKPGFCGIFEAFDSARHEQGNDIEERLRELGFSEGLPIEFLHASPLGRDPIVIAIGRMTIAIRRREARVIKVRAS